MRCRWLITGAGGQFGSVLLRELSAQGETAGGLISPHGPPPFVGDTLRVDITDRDDLSAAVRGARPAFIIHAAAVTNVNAAFQDPQLARRTNVQATQHLAELADEFGARLVLISTDLVFDGKAPPYHEHAATTPLSVYGRTKADAERQTLRFDRALVLRLPLMYGLPAVGRETTFVRQLEAIRRGDRLQLFLDEFRTPLALVDAARAVAVAARSDLDGILHVAGPERLSRLEMGRIAARAIQCSDGQIIPAHQGDVDFPEPRPRDVSLDSSRYADRFGAPAGRPMAEAMIEIARDLGAARGR